MEQIAIFLSMGDDPKYNNYNWYVVSQVVGYIYTVAWGVSFLGQIGLNFKLKEVSGCNLDFVLYNFTGFCFYAAYNTAGFVNPKASGIDCELNDLIFAWWSWCMTVITMTQCIIYPKHENKLSLTAKIATPIYFIIVIAYTLLQFAFGVIKPTSNYYNAWYIMSYFKLWISLTKYMPQAYMNYKRKSTKGWSIFNIMLDFTGGSFSFGQMAIDAANGTSDPFSSSDGGQGLNVAKFGLSVISIVFDLLFMFQHYCLYNDKNIRYVQGEELQEDADLDAPFVNKVIENKELSMQQQGKKNNY